MGDPISPGETASSSFKVLFVISGLDPKAGGPPSSAQKIWLSVRRQAIEISAAFGVRRPISPVIADTILELSLRGVRTHPFPFSRIFGDIAEPWGISLRFVGWCMRSARDFDIIQVHGCWTFPTLVSAIAAKVYGKPFVIVPHETLTAFDMSKNPSWLKRLLKRSLKSLLLRACDAIVFSSSLEQQDSVGQKFGTKSTVAYHPVVDETDARRHARTWPRKLSNIRVGFLGRFDPKKNLDLLIEAIAQIPHASLYVAGEGSDFHSRYLYNLANRLGVTGRIHWLGFMSARDLGGLFEGVDVIVMPSAYECFGRAAAEAMSHGLPVIVSKATGVSEIVTRDQCGIVIKPEVNEIRNAIEMLFNNPLSLSEYSLRSITATERDLSLASYGMKLSQLYTRLCRKK